MHIAGRVVGHDQPTYVIAEAGVNHNGDMSLAHRLIDAARQAGADGVKFQAFVSEELVTPATPKAGYQVQTTGDGGQLAMLKALELSADQHAELKHHCETVGITYICTPYDDLSVDMLDRLGVAAYKIASTDTTNTPFLSRLAAKGRPVILSTGMSTLAEVEEAVTACAAVADRLLLLHCTSEYPAPPEEANLRAIATLRAAFGLPVGFSDHTAGVGLSPTAVAVGACVIEKHFTLDRALKGPDHSASVEPAELADLVRQIRLIERAMGDGIKRPTAAEIANKPRMQKSLVLRRATAAGETITVANLTCKRPGGGLPPSWLERVAGRRAARAIDADHSLTLGDVDWS
ncbi:MAG: N-acetylneuraminate synthase [Alphaproteobacteria bacterium]|nr:N-acetylneuraminate synthase [Alphaproteobacteria bacterium]